MSRLSEYEESGIVVAKMRMYGHYDQARVEIRRVQKMWSQESSQHDRLLAVEAYLSAYREAVHQNRLQRQAYLKSFRRVSQNFLGV